MDANMLNAMMAAVGGDRAAAPGGDKPQPDSSEQINVSPLALLKMLKHGRAGVPMEVMGLMLGEFVDEYTVTVTDVFAMPQSGTGVSVEAVDHAFQSEMLEMLRQTGRPEMVVGWYHSHPGFGCWLSGTDMATQQSFEQLNPRAVAVVIDPVQSVKGKVVMDAFRLGDHMAMVLGGGGGGGMEARQTTSNVGGIAKPSVVALVHGLGRHYYSLAINYRMKEGEERMLACLSRSGWSDGFALRRFGAHDAGNEEAVRGMRDLAVSYEAQVREEDETPPERLAVVRAGKVDAKGKLEEQAKDAMSANILQTLGMMLDTVTF
uniref:MPN domain-containing protein n=1 Tax=Oryza punctata TaxID=4537 RepID=A0A0E0LFD1_ORYPU